MNDDPRDRERAANDAHWALLARYLDGAATPDQRTQVERWAAASDANRSELAELRRLWQLTGALPSPARVDDLWRALAGRMQQAADADAAPRAAAPPASPRVRPTPRTPAMHMRAIYAPAPRFLRRWQVAAGLALVAGAGAGLHWRATDPTPRTAGAAALAAREVTTAPGHHLRVRLEDGTSVDLAPESRLRVAAAARGPRAVDLEGEAVFTVTHDARRPFVVRTRGGVAEDLGTTFAVRAPAGDDTTRVVVLAGLVSLRAPHAPARDATALRPGQLGTLSAGGLVEVETAVDTAAYAAWSRGRLLFREARLGDVTREVGRWYGVAIRIPDAGVADRRVTLDMPARPLREVLGAVAVPLGLRAVRTGRTVVLTPGRPVRVVRPSRSPLPANAP